MASWKERTWPAAARCFRGAPGTSRDRRPSRARGDGVDRRAHDDLQESVAVEVRRGRLSDAADRLLEASPLAAQLLEARLQLAGHGVELLAQLGELVVALGGHGRGEVAARQAPGAGEEAPDLRLQRARHEQGEAEGERHEDDEDDRGHAPAVGDVGRHGFGVVEDRDAHRLVAEAAGAEGRGTELGVVDVQGPHARERVVADAGDRRGDGAPAALHGSVEAGDAPDQARVLGRRWSRRRAAVRSGRRRTPLRVRAADAVASGDPTSTSVRARLTTAIRRSRWARSSSLARVCTARSLPERSAADIAGSRAIRPAATPARSTSRR